MCNIISKSKKGFLNNPLFYFLTAGLIIGFTILENLLFVKNNLYYGTEMTQWVKLFNGTDLKGWKVFGGGRWEVINGEIVGKFDPYNENRGWLVCEDEYEDFNLRLKYKITKGGDSGVCLRVPTDKIQTAESSGYEIEILNDNTVLSTSGAVYNLQRTYFGIEKDDQWNEFKISVSGDRITVFLNDSVTADIHNRRSLKGLIGLQIPDENSTVQFKDIEIQQVPAKRPLGPTLEEKMNRAPGEWKSLFNGKDLRGWHVVWAPSMPKNFNLEPHWIAEDGKIVGKEIGSPGWILSTQEFENFIFRIKWRQPLGGNSGVTIRCPFPVTFAESLRDPAYAGFEIQVASQNPNAQTQKLTPERERALKQRRFTREIFHNVNGGFYNVANAWPNLTDNTKWNEYLIYAYGDHLVCYVNGVKACETHVSSGHSLRGSVGMQIHGGGESNAYTEFKDIEIKEISRLE